MVFSLSLGKTLLAMASPTSPQQTGTISNVIHRGRNLKLTPPASVSAAAIQAMIEQYSVGLKPVPAKVAPQALQGPLVVLLTGSTGNLGSEILLDLLKNDRVQHVYTFNRPSTRGDAIEDRQIKAFNERRLDTTFLRSEKLSYVLGDATRPDLGIDHKHYDLVEFEPHIQATRNLADFLKAGPHAAHGRFLFTSSISIAQSWPPSKGPYPEKIVTDASYAVGIAYGASKYIAERVVSWVPMNAVAAAVVEAGSSNKTLPEAVNLVNPRPTNLIKINGYLTAATKKLLGIHLDPVSLDQWLTILEQRHSASPETLRNLPPPALLSYFRSVSNLMNQFSSSEVEAEHHLPTFATDVMCQTSPRTMEELREVRKEDAEMWIRYWQDIKFLDGKVKSRL
ncbi:hypothetical protein H0H93_010844 [Arthromyces matolae]|nr:hypothetical protein H0H93_010844 [Arthromyces matolae]